MDIQRGGYIHRLFLWGSDRRWDNEQKTTLNLCTGATTAPRSRSRTNL